MARSVPWNHHFFRMALIAPVGIGVVVHALVRQIERDRAVYLFQRPEQRERSQLSGEAPFLKGWTTLSCEIRVPAM